MEYSEGNVFVRNKPSQKLTWRELCFIAHKAYHKMPSGMEPGLQAQHVFQVPGGGVLPDADMRVQIYPCFSFQAHVPYVEIDPATGHVSILEYTIGHDCGTMINPMTLKGHVRGGVVNGIGSTLLEHYHYDENGQLQNALFTDYLLPSTLESPPNMKVGHVVTPSPFTEYGIKGGGEGGRMGTPPALTSAIEDALKPLGITIDELPLSPNRLRKLIRDAQSSHG